MSTRLLSPSALDKLMSDPRAYKKRYITFDDDKQRPSDTIVLGSLIHCNLASENEAKTFKKVDWELPSEKIQDILWVYYQNTYSKIVSDPADYDLTFKDDKSLGSQKLLELCKAFGFNQHLATDKGRLEHFTKNDKGGDKYWEHLKMYKGKVNLIQTEQSEWAKSVSNAIKANKVASEIINFEQSSFEIKLTCDYGPHFGLQGIIDNHWLSPDGNHLYINDFKTSELTLEEYANKKLKSRYDKSVPNQIAQYDELLKQTIGEEIFQDLIVHRTVIYIGQKTGYVYPFKITDETFNYWKQNWKSDLRKAEWHFQENNFELPHDYQNNLIQI